MKEVDLNFIAQEQAMHFGHFGTFAQIHTYLIAEIQNHAKQQLVLSTKLTYKSTFVCREEVCVTGKVTYTKYSKHCPYIVAHKIDCVHCKYIRGNFYSF